MTPEMVRDALKSVVDPDLQADIVSLKFVKDIGVDGDRVRLTVESPTPSPGKRAALEQQSGNLAANWRGLARYWRKRLGL